LLLLVNDATNSENRAKNHILPLINVFNSFVKKIRTSNLAAMSAEKIISDWKRKLYKPIYWLEGDEEYFIDKVTHYAENNILTEAEAGFNLTVFYGKDAQWPDIINACRRYPMFAERQVVIIKEAQQMKDIDKLETYIEHPLTSTVLVVAFKEKKVDGRTKLAKLLKEKGVVLTTKKLYEDQVKEFTIEMARNKGLSIQPKALILLVDHIGSDLNRIDSEINKIFINLGEGKTITENDIEKYVGISKDFNVFELQSAIGSKNLAKSLRIINYFEANPKAAPIQLVLPSIYGFFSKLYMLYGLPAKDDKSLATAIGVNVYFLKDYLKAKQLFTYPDVEQALLLLHQYNLKSVGVNDSGTPSASLLKEMVVKMFA
jgi:DNA polymerase-3 subunit delta